MSLDRDGNLEMANHRLTHLQRCLHDLADGRTADRDLLRRFLEEHDERAFTTLVRRHDRLVRSAIAKVLGNTPDAEDAYQATFLVLVRRARAIDWRTGLGPWLYGVAHRVAVKAQVHAVRRARRESSARAARSILPADLSWQEACDLLHAELDRLPDKYRLPLLVCYLEGKTREEAAVVLGLTAGTVRGRVRRGLDVLRQRLARRGVTLSVGLLAVLAAPSAITAALPAPTLVTAAVYGAAPASVTILAQEVIMGSVLSRLGRIIAIVAVAMGVTAGLLAAARQEQPTSPTAAQAGGAIPVQLVPKPGGKGKLLLLARESDLVALTPEGKTGNALTTPDETRTMRQGRLSPDGTRAAFVVNSGKPRNANDDLNAPWPIQLVIRRLGTTEAKTLDFPGFGLDAVWAPDGKRLAVTKYSRDTSETFLVDPVSGKTEPLALPAGVHVLDWSADGKTFLVVYRKDKQYRLGLCAKGATEPGGLTVLKLRFASLAAARFSPDGKKVLFTDADPEQKDAHKWHRSSQPHVVDIATGKRQPLADFPKNGQCLGVAWSPDGKRVAYTWTQLHPEVLQKESVTPVDVAVPTEAFLIIADADGRNARTIASDRSDQALNPIYGSIDWR